jgi:hypothetical protein
MSGAASGRATPEPVLPDFLCKWLVSGGRCTEPGALLPAPRGHLATTQTPADTTQTPSRTYPEPVFQRPEAISHRPRPRPPRPDAGLHTPRAHPPAPRAHLAPIQTRLTQPRPHPTEPRLRLTHTEPRRNYPDFRSRNSGSCGRGCVVGRGLRCANGEVEAGSSCGRDAHPTREGNRIGVRASHRRRAALKSPRPSLVQFRNFSTTDNIGLPGHETAVPLRRLRNLLPKNSPAIPIVSSMAEAGSGTILMTSTGTSSKCSANSAES